MNVDPGATAALVLPLVAIVFGIVLAVVVAVRRR